MSQEDCEDEIESDAAVMEQAHDLSHELAERLLATIDAFVAEKGQKPNGRNVASLGIILWATEIPASVCRRLCRDGKVTKDMVNAVRHQASDCARSYYEAMADARDKAEDLTRDVGFIVNPDQKYEH